MTMSKKKLWLIILGAVFAGIVISVITNSTTSAMTKSSFCLNCHDAPEFSSSRADTPHANLECLSCHGEGFLKDKVNGVGHLVSTITGKMDPNAYTEYGAEVTNEKCLSCHNIENKKRDGEVVKLHLNIAEKDMTCTRCHDTLFFHGHEVK